MAWIKKTCKCVKPNSQEVKEVEAGPGSIWSCDRCSKQWILTGGVTIIGDGWTPYVADLHGPEFVDDEQIRQEVGLNQ
jgi:hypothetical protein